MKNFFDAPEAGMFSDSQLFSFELKEHSISSSESIFFIIPMRVVTILF